MKKIKPQKLTQDKFKPFGDVIEAHHSVKNFTINDGHTQRYHDLAKIDLGRNSGKTLVNIFRSTPLVGDIVIEKMECHPLSSQSFIPMGEQPYLVVVAPLGDFNESEIKIFVANKDQGVNYHPGTWHHYSLALNNVSDFLVIDRGGDGENCNIESLKQPFIIELLSKGDY